LKNCAISLTFKVIKRSQTFFFTGKPVYDEAGELVCTKPFPSMPVLFWNDSDGQKYKKAYFSMFPGKF
jgi:acetoacetyl-CoA synthetase